jgi:hypothetical protein
MRRQVNSVILDQTIGLLVIDNKSRLVGILTDGDLLRHPKIGTHPEQSRWCGADEPMPGRAIRAPEASGAQARVS